MSKLNLSGNSPKCVGCKKLYSLKKANEQQEILAHVTGLCPHCQAKDNVDINKFDQAEVAEAVTLTNERRSAIPPKIEHSGKIVRETFASVIDKLTPETVTALQDKEYTFKTFGIRFPFIKPIDPVDNTAIKEQLRIKGRARYSSSLLSIQGNTYAITNDIYSQSVPKVLDWAKAI